MDIQKTDWGQIEWLQVADASPLKQSMSVGIATINPYVTQKSHVHYENEQFIYIIQGAGVDIINGESHQFEEGMFYYLPPNITHQLVNTGGTAVRHILVTVYTASKNTIPNELPDIENYSGYLCAAVEAIRSQLTGSNSPPIAIFDDMGNLVLQAGNYPQYCVEHCSPDKAPGGCQCFHQREAPTAVLARNSASFVCANGLTVFQLPILYRTHFLGSIFSGHVLLSNESREKAIDMYDTPTGTILAIRKWAASIAESIVSFCSFNALRSNLSVKDSVIAQERHGQRLLENRLKVMQNTMTNLKINRHFLFNTLNAIAGQALEGDEAATYQAITDLAKMFRYSTSVDLKIVPLKEEIEYLRTYIHMQQLRYGDSLSATIHYRNEVLNGLVPFNFLQPFVENAFTHGFVDTLGHRILTVTILRQNENLIFSISNNGAIIDSVTINRVLGGMSSESGHGLSLVYSKLKTTYGENFSIDMTSNEQEGTKMVIALPFKLNREL